VLLAGTPDVEVAILVEPKGRLVEPVMVEAVDSEVVADVGVPDKEGNLIDAFTDSNLAKALKPGRSALGRDSKLEGVTSYVLLTADTEPPRGSELPDVLISANVKRVESAGGSGVAWDDCGFGIPNEVLEWLPNPVPDASGVAGVDVLSKSPAFGFVEAAVQLSDKSTDVPFVQDKIVPAVVAALPLEPKPVCEGYAVVLSKAGLTPGVGRFDGSVFVPELL